MNTGYVVLLLLVFGLLAALSGGSKNVSITISSGPVCGAVRVDANGGEYASFRGVPYAKPPLGELRFAELQPADPWTDCFNATVEGDICPQTNIMYGTLLQPRGMSEDCIHANIHVPIDALPEDGKDLANNGSGLPIFIFIHGGGFQTGSGDSDMNGPERLVARGVIPITINYRLNVFGLLSLNTTKIPGNNSLRDIITFLKWVRTNAASFGGNPDDVTLAGQSAGAVLVHLLSLSPAAQGLFNRTVLLSGTAISGFYTTSPVYAATISAAFLEGLGITSTDSDEVYQQLIDMPLANITEVNSILQDKQGFNVFNPVVESPLSGVEMIIPEDPNVMLSKGYGKDIPLLMGFTSAECETFRPRLDKIDIVGRINTSPLNIAPFPLSYMFSSDVALSKAYEVKARYFTGNGSTDESIKALSDGYFVYSALKTIQYRQNSSGAQTFVYEYSYQDDNSPAKLALSLNFTGGGHIEDLMTVFKVHSVAVPYNETTEAMNNLMTGYITNFIKYSSPLEDNSWQSLNSTTVLYEMINKPDDVYMSTLTDEQTSIFNFFDGIHGY